MPIYAYRCETCGHAKDVLQKISDPVLSTCPACGAETFRKQVTAAGFQLKGSGWYVTDFRGGDTTSKEVRSGDESAAADKSNKADKPAAADSKPASGADKPAATGSGSASSPAPAPAPAATSSSSAAAPAPSSGGSSTPKKN